MPYGNFFISLELCIQLILKANIIEILEYDGQTDLMKKSDCSKKF